MNTRRTVFLIEELDCAEEVRQLRVELERVAGVEQLDFDVMGHRMVVTFADESLSEDDIVSRIGRLKMRARVVDESAGSGQATDPGDRASAAAARQEWSRVGMAVAAGILLVVACVVHGISAPSWSVAFGLETLDATTHLPLASRLLYIASLIFSGWFVVPKAWLALRRLTADINILMCIAAVGAVAIGQWFEASVVTFLFSVSLLLEHWSLGRARRAIASLLDLAPTTVRRKECCTGDIEERPIEQIVPGDTIVIRPGERIALDGVIMTGETSVDQSPITGESLPIAKQPGEQVYAGSLNVDGAIELQVTHAANDTTLARIVHMVQEARSRRAPTEQWVEQFARYYTPAMILLAIGVAVVPPLVTGLAWPLAIYNALVLLVIACPCALVISTPVSIVSALTVAARHGVLIKGGRYLETAAHLKAIAIDKTGTLTEGRPEVRKIVPLNDHSRQELLERAAAMEAGSTHPIAQAVLRCASDEDVAVRSAESYRALAGRGAEGLINGKPYWIGSQRFMKEKTPHTDEATVQSDALENSGHSVVAIGTADHVCGLIGVADVVRKESRTAIRRLQAMGIEHVVMLTGDNPIAARAVADAVGIEEFFAATLPEEKVRHVERLGERYGVVAMIGDGVNDAPAMAASSLGIAMGAIGTDAAIEAADIALMSDELVRVPWLIQLARKTLRVIKQNIAIALGLKLIFIGLTIASAASLWMAIAADMGASLLVVMNGLRLLRTRG
jgi:Cd2+/Zn2+-exporting ATPase